jgi:hypothetical protein
MKIKSEKVLPQTIDEITNGGVYLQRRRCGKKNCRCVGGELHSGYYFIRRINGKFTKSYIRQADVDYVVALVKQASVARRLTRQNIKENNELAKSFNSQNRETDLIIKLLKIN